MPRCGSQIILCDLPVRFDTYVGCSHACKYCFVTRKADITQITTGESAAVLQRWIDGKRTAETKWCNWDLPLHWGGMSDPFQPIEAKHKVSLDCLKVFAESKYPFVVSTKGTPILAKPEYLKLLKECKAVVQVSLISPKLDHLEPGAPSFEKRLADLSKISRAALRTIIRIQPYIREAKADIIANLKRYAAAGVYGITIEGIKYFQRRPGLVKSGADYVYPVNTLRQDYEQIRAACREAGLHFFCAENRLRGMGEDLCCCGIAGLDDFKPMTANLVHFVRDGEMKFTDHMAKSCSTCFKALSQDTVASGVFQRASFSEIMTIFSKDSTVLNLLKDR